MHSLFTADTRHERQVQDPRQGTCSSDEFTRRQSAVLCNPSNDGYEHPLVDIYNECTIEARFLVQSCTQGENGMFCYELRQNASNYVTTLMENCPCLSNYSEYQCTNSCRDALQNSKSNLGCCFSVLFNASSSPLSNFLNTSL